MIHRNKQGQPARMPNKPLAKFGAAIPAILTTPEAAEDDEAGAAVRIEQARYERQILDFESEIRSRRDQMHTEHLDAMRAALNGEVSG